MKYHIMADHSHLVKNVRPPDLFYLTLSLLIVSLKLLLAPVKWHQGPGRSCDQRETTQNPEETRKVEMLQRGKLAVCGEMHQDEELQPSTFLLGLQRGIQQHHGIRVPHEEVWEAGVWAGEAAAQLLPLWESLQVQSRSGVSPEIGARPCESQHPTRLMLSGTCR